MSKKVSQRPLIFTIPLKIVKLCTGPSTWKSKDVEGDVLFTKLEGRSEPWEVDSSDFVEALLSVTEKEDAESFLNRFGHPGINSREYTGSREVRQRR